MDSEATSSMVKGQDFWKVFVRERLEIKRRRLFHHMCGNERRKVRENIERIVDDLPFSGDAPVLESLWSNTLHHLKAALCDLSKKQAVEKARGYLDTLKDLDSLSKDLRQGLEDVFVSSHQVLSRPHDVSHEDKVIDVTEKIQGISDLVELRSNILPGLSGALSRLPNEEAMNETQNHLSRIKILTNRGNLAEKVAENLEKIHDSSESILDKIKVASVCGFEEVENPVTCGLALSGGGIRSATFNLGVLQALEEVKVLPRIDYLSTVSGGGYIGSALTYFMHHYRGKFPFNRSDFVEWIRRNASYLTPGDGLNIWALIAAVLRGVLINAALLAPLLAVLLGCLWLLTWGKPPVWMTGNRWVVMAVLGSFLFMEIFVRRFALKRRLLDNSPVPYRDLAIIGIVLLFLSLVFLQISDRYLVLILFVLLPIFFVLGYGVFSMVWDVFRQPNQPKRWYFLFELLAWSTVFGIVYWLLTAVGWLSGLVLQDSWPEYRPYMAFLILAGCALLGRLLVAYVFYAALSQTCFRLGFASHRHFSVQYGDYLVWGVVLVSIGLIPALYASVTHVGGEYWQGMLSSMSLGGIVSTVIGWIKERKATELLARAKEVRGYVVYFLRVGLALLLISGVLWSYHLVFKVITGSPGSVGLPLWLWGAIFILWLLAVIATDINYVSMHRYYRNRLVEAFFYRSKSGDETLPLHLPFWKIDIGTTGAPYHIVNTNLVTVGSGKPKYRARLGDNFIFSPQFFGAESTGWAPSSSPGYEAMNLGTAMAISGAAVDPNIGETRSWPLRIIMGLLNVRLGYWLQHPDQQGDNNENGDWKLLVRKLFHESWISLSAREMLGFPKDDWKYVRLSDGGHFENLGLYELVRRECGLIIVSDATADPNWRFRDLARALERVRADFDVTIDINKIDDLKPAYIKNNEPEPNDETRLSTEPFVVGKIRYKKDQNGNRKQGLFIYLNTTLFPNLPEDVKSYARRHGKFPNEPTSDQFFDEEQFEAYRVLGYHTVRRMRYSTNEEISPFLWHETT